MDDHATSQRRSIQVNAYGDSVAELEMCALDAAREFFGSDVILHVVRDYRVKSIMNLWSSHPNAGDKKWYASVRIQVED